jgi:hypothetical protein
MIDACVASKYGSDVTEITRLISKGVRDSFDAFKTEFKQDVANSLPRQIRGVVQRVQEELQGKREMNSSNTQGHSAVAAPGTLDISARNAMNFNLQQPYYQTVSYGPSLLPAGNGFHKGPFPMHIFLGLQGHQFLLSPIRLVMVRCRRMLGNRWLERLGNLGLNLKGMLDHTRNHT